MTETTLSRMDDPDLQKLDTPESRAELAKRSAERARLDVKPPATCASEAGESAVVKASADLVNAPKGSFRDGGVVPPKAAIVERPDGVSTGGHKNDAGKPPLALLPWEALIDVAKVLDAGAAKYGRDNWRKGVGYHRLLDAQMRHLAAFTMGEDYDAETGLSHLAHAACCNLFLLALVKQGRTDLDDRYRAAVEK